MAEEEDDGTTDLGVDRPTTNALTAGDGPFLRRADDTFVDSKGTDGRRGRARRTFTFRVFIVPKCASKNGRSDNCGHRIHFGNCFDHCCSDGLVTPLEPVAADDTSKRLLARIICCWTRDFAVTLWPCDQKKGNVQRPWGCKAEVSFFCCAITHLCTKRWCPGVVLETHPPHQRAVTKAVAWDDGLPLRKPVGRRRERLQVRHGRRLGMSGTCGRARDRDPFGVRRQS